jgi:glycine dehydrogenase
MGYGGPRRLFCYKRKYKRSMPGIIGVSQDASEIVCVWRYKHVNISNVKATSNICTAQVFIYLWQECLLYITDQRIGILPKIHGMASTLADALNKLGVYQTNTAFFDTIVVKTDAKRLERLQKRMKLISFISMTNFYLFKRNNYLQTLTQVIAVLQEA